MTERELLQALEAGGELEHIALGYIWELQFEIEDLRARISDLESWHEEDAPLVCSFCDF